MPIQIEITTTDVGLTVDNTQATVVEVDTSVTLQNADNLTVTPHSWMSSVALQAALEEIVDNYYKQISEPTANLLNEGKQWFNPDTEDLKICRETSPSTYEWVPIMVGNISDDSDNVDAGAF